MQKDADVDLKYFDDDNKIKKGKELSIEIITKGMLLLNRWESKKFKNKIKEEKEKERQK